jgi:uncharacterized protein YoxC
MTASIEANRRGMGGESFGPSCQRCGASVRAEQRFCTDCGDEMVRPMPGVAAEVSAAEGETSERSGTAVRRRRSRRAIALTVVASSLIVALACASTYLARELSSARGEINALETTNASLEQDLAQTKKQLGSSLALSARRKRVLEQAESVVDRVDPVLSSADGMQDLTGQMQDEQASFATNSDSAIGYLASMVDYLSSTDAYYYDISYIRSVLDGAVSAYEASRTDADQLDSLSSKYGAASRGFETKATGYTLAVERLQKQLKAATK